MSLVHEPPRRSSALSGRTVVAMMFLFGIAATGALYVYWTLHLMPFMPLQEAIEAEFPGSAPRVDGGQRKKRDNTPVILRIVMKTELELFSADADVLAARDKMRSRVVELSRQHTTLPDLQFVELHLYKLIREQEIIERSFRFDLMQTVWEEIDGKGSVIAEAAPAGVLDGAATDRSGGAAP